MELRITTRHTTLTDAIRNYAQKRLSKLDRRFHESLPVNLLIRKENTKREEDRFVAEVTVRLRKVIIRGEERGSSPYAAIDLVEDKIDRRIRRYKTRFSSRRRSATRFESDIAVQLTDQTADTDDVVELRDGVLVRTKRHEVLPMDVEEAARGEWTNRGRVVYRRHNFFLFRSSPWKKRSSSRGESNNRRVVPHQFGQILAPSALHGGVLSGW